MSRLYLHQHAAIASVVMFVLAMSLAACALPEAPSSVPAAANVESEAPDATTQTGAAEEAASPTDAAAGEQTTGDEQPADEALTVGKPPAGSKPRVESDGPRVKSDEPRVKSQNPPGGSSEPPAKPVEPRVKSQEAPNPGGIMPMGGPALLFDTIEQGCAPAGDSDLPQIAVARTIPKQRMVAALVNSPEGADKLAAAGAAGGLAIAVVRGKASPGYGIEVQDVLVNDASVDVIVRLLEPEAGRMYEDVICYPYHVIAISPDAGVAPFGVPWIMRAPAGEPLAKTIPPR